MAIEITSEGSQLKIVDTVLVHTKYLPNDKIYITVDGDYVELGDGNPIDYNDVTIPTVVSAVDLADQIGELTASGASGGVYSSYVALLSQTGTNAPTETILQNELGLGDISWARVSQGRYIGTLVGAFSAGKTIILQNNSEQLKNIAFGISGTDAIAMNCRDFSGVLQDIENSFQCVEIRVYP